MEIKFEIIDKLYEDIKLMCDINHMTVENYISKCVMDNYYTLKYGDLNEKINGIKIKEKENFNENNITLQQKKKVGRPRKVKIEKAVESENEKEETKLTGEKMNDTLVKLEKSSNSLLRKEETVNTDDKNLSNVIKHTTKRTLKVR